MLKKINQKYNIILASQSPRRQELLKELGLEFSILVKKNIDESYPKGLNSTEIALYLAEHKASYYIEDLKQNDLLITADTIVCYNNKILNKPANYEEAKEMLKLLSGNKHQVITGVCLRTKQQSKTFAVSTDVYFNNISEQEIDFYINNYKPYDKAGAYGIQEWIGYIAVKKIEGSYFNVVGLPVQYLYEELKKMWETK